ncbi:PD-(D/E)XK nuclease-like domain-containing protein [Caballeronia sp. TF1N1]|uniref:PD-(D/E)XK nuclease-like domain-containing protein n=1 Tax=Caballeronia sp. TF1N1 TaxID=2878153 RepID=UPI001FD39B3F|nr:PD-(D/E)XK nuclease-like domain-containing protein [Caballeronia sp. TF1N1]
MVSATTDFRPGRYDDFPSERYYALEALSASGIAKLLRSAAHYRAWRDTPSPATPAMQFGTVVHGLVLEPERDIVALAPTVERRSNADKATWAAFEAQLDGRIAMKQADFDRARRVRDAVFAHAGARTLLDASGQSEVTLLWHDDEQDTLNKARIDRLRDDGGIVDLKTTSDVTPAVFARKAANGQLYVQAAHYREGCARVLNAPSPFFAWVAVETDPPYGVRCYSTDDAGLTLGRKLAEQAAWIYAEAVRTGQWPGYPETVDPLPLPKWALPSDDIEQDYP